MQEYVSNPQTQPQMQPQVQPQAQPQPPKKKKTGKIILIIIAVLIYTAVVATATVFIDRAIIENETQITQREKKSDKSEDKDADSDADSGSGDKSGSGDNSAADGNSNSVDVDSNEGAPDNNAGTADGTISLNQKVNVGTMFELTLLEGKWCEEIYPSNTSDYYSYFADKEGEKYFAVKAKVKNISSKEVDFQYDSDCVIKADGKYEVVGVAETENSDGDGFYGNIKPLQEGNVIIYFSVSDEMYNTCSSFEVTLDVANNEAAAEKYPSSWEKDDYNTYKITFTK